jgi:hypothetical protein
MQWLVFLMSVVAAIRFDTEDEVARIMPIHAGCARISQAHLLSARLAFTRDSTHAAISLRIHADERVDNLTGASLILLAFALRSD